MARVDSCCESTRECVFAKALLSRTAECELVERRALAERELLECGSPVARLNCGTLAALFHERARFALRLPGPERPLMHIHALRLQCGGLTAMQQLLATERPDVHRLVGLAHQRHGSLTDLPWAEIVREMAQWQAPRRRPR